MINILQVKVIENMEEIERGRCSFIQVEIDGEKYNKGKMKDTFIEKVKPGDKLFHLIIYPNPEVFGSLDHIPDMMVRDYFKEYNYIAYVHDSYTYYPHIHIIINAKREKRTLTDIKDVEKSGDQGHNFYFYIDELGHYSEVEKIKYPIAESNIGFTCGEKWEKYKREHLEIFGKNIDGIIEDKRNSIHSKRELKKIVNVILLIFIVFAIFVETVECKILQIVSILIIMKLNRSIPKKKLKQIFLLEEISRIIKKMLIYRSIKDEEYRIIEYKYKEELEEYFK